MSQYSNLPPKVRNRLQSRDKKTGKAKMVVVNQGMKSFALFLKEKNDKSQS